MDAPLAAGAFWSVMTPLVIEPSLGGCETETTEGLADGSTRPSR